jgi:hypothetical protein
VRSADEAASELGWRGRAEAGEGARDLRGEIVETAGDERAQGREGAGDDAGAHFDGGGNAELLDRDCAA